MKIDHAGENKVGSWHDRGPIRSAFRFGWDAIQTWIVRPKPARGANRDEEEAEADQQRIRLDENRER